MKRVWFIIAIIGAFLIFSGQPADALYKWIDEKGTLHITGDPPPTGSKIINAPEEDLAPQPAPTPTPPSVPASSPEAAPSGEPTRTAPTAGVIAQPVTPATVQPAAPEPSVQSTPEEKIKKNILSLIAAMGIMIVVIGIVLYIFLSFCLFEIANRASYENAWLAWVPLLQIFAIIGAAGKPWYWIFFLLIPLVNVVVTVYLWICICENLGKNKLLGLWIIVPLAAFVLMPYLAFSKHEEDS